MRCHRQNGLAFQELLGSLFLAMILLSLVGWLNLQRWNSSVQLTERYGRRLDFEWEEATKVCMLKRRTAEDLAAGRITLKEAATTALAIDSSLPRALSDLRLIQPGSTDLEREARHMIARSLQQFCDPVILLFTASRLLVEFNVLVQTSSPAHLKLH